MIILGIILLIFGFMATVAIPGFRILGMILIIVSIIVIRIGLEMKVARMKRNSINNLYKNGSILGKDLQYIESYLGPHTSVNISNDDKRVFTWGDYFEVVCDKNNKCIEVLKQ